MNLDSVSDKHLGELERLSGELLAVLRRAQLSDTPLAMMLSTLESESGELRRARFDAGDSEYSGF